MFLKNPRLLFKSSSFRIITWFSVFFFLSFFAINIYAYTFISSAIYKQSRSEVEEDILELRDIYLGSGLESLKLDVFEDSNDVFLVRLSTESGITPLLRIPRDWSGADLGQLERNPLYNKDGWEYLSDSRGGKIFEVRTLLLSGGSILQIGQTIEKREKLLGYFRKIYLISLIPTALVAYLGGLFVADKALNPVRQLINTLDSIVENAKVDVRVPEEKSDKLYHELTVLFNSMLGSIEGLMDGIRGVLDNLAHDLRTPMTRLRITAEAAVESKHNEDNMREALYDCIEESDRILIILNTILDVTGAETGAMSLNPENLNVIPVIDDIVDLYGYVAQDKGVSVRASCPGELYLTADPHRIRQVLANLLDNAIKYTPPGGRVDIRAQKLKQDVKITVEDTGMGIPEDELKHIWDRLYRGDKSRSQSGLGLGLSLVKAIVGAHRGYVEVLSKPGTGSYFSVYIPC